MSSPQTDTERQARRHKPALIGIAVALIAALIFVLAYFLVPQPPADEQATPVPTEPQVGADDAAVEGAGE